MLVAQVVTIAALGRAAWLAFFRRRPRDYERSERLRPGMFTGLIGLSVCCFAFGVLPQFVLDHLMAPAASGLLHADAYSSAVLAGSGLLPTTVIAVHYADALELAVGAISILIAAALARVYLRIKEPSPIRVLRAVHTGSVNDYAGFAVGGAIVLIAVLNWV